MTIKDIITKEVITDEDRKRLDEWAEEFKKKYAYILEKED